MQTFPENTIVVATGNQNKVKEIAAIFAENGVTAYNLITLADLPGYVEPEENGETFEANAKIKAAAAARFSGLLAIADDSGLAVDALGGAPGVYSARYAGEGHDDAANRKRLFQEMADIPDGQRAARFVCSAVIAFPDPGGNVDFWTAEAYCEGTIAHEERGENGFGYDCMLYLPEFGQTMAEISPEQKNQISHRGKAFERVARLLNFMHTNGV